MKKSRNALILSVAALGGILLILLVLLVLVCIDREIITLPGAEEKTTADSSPSSRDDEKTPEVVNQKENSGTTATNNVKASVAMVREPLCTPKGNGEDTVTVMLYFNGSNLESDWGCATDDFAEMIDATHSSRVNLVLQTMGTKEWQNYNIASDHTQRFTIDDDGLTLVDDSQDQLDCTAEQTLANFIKWSAENYPADRYMLVLWDHGGGSVEGFGYNEWGRYSDSLTTDELRNALEEGGVNFDFVGFDACIMSSMEICYALYDHADYAILSEDFESSLGWYYTGWLSALAENPSIDMTELGTMIVNDMVEANEKDYREGSSSTLALIDERYVPTLIKSWEAFAYANEETLLAMNYSTEVDRSSRAKVEPEQEILDMETDEPGQVDADKNDAAKVDIEEMQEYYITDMMAVVSSVPSSESKPAARAIKNCIVAYDCTDDDKGLTGISVTLPYNDSDFYDRLKPIFFTSGFDKNYIIWLEKFTDASSQQYDYEEFEESWDGWDSYTDN